MDEQHGWFFDAYVGFHPEEATTLGLTRGADRLRDHSPAGLEAERRFWQDAASRLEGDDSIDGQWLGRMVAFHLRSWDWLWCGIEWSLYPYTMVEAQLIHATTPAERAAVDARLADLPRFLHEHEHNMLAGMKRGVAPDELLLSFYVDQQIPGAERRLRSMDLPHAPGAADALSAHRSWLQREIRQAQPCRLGADELDWRMRKLFGIDTPIEALIARGREELAIAQEAMIALCTRIRPARSIGSFDDARTLTLELGAEMLASDEDVVPTYQRYIDRALALCRSEKLFDIPDDYRIGIQALPSGFETVGSAANWPAPLKAPDKLGHFLVSMSAKNHSRGWAADLAVHEGLPGHHLQSFMWQRRFHDHPAPVRFLLVHDQVAIPRHDWAPMLNIEGWAVYSEVLMRRHGMFDPFEELFAWAAHAARAARVVADLSLHLGAMTPDDVLAFLGSEGCLSPRINRLELHRYLQIPLQATTYLLGCLAIEDLEREVRQIYGSDFDSARFHERFFSYGPIDPGMIRKAMLG